MPRVKKESKQATPKSWRDVKHGCCSCKYYELIATKEPCKSCERWSNWVDKSNE